MSDDALRAILLDLISDVSSASAELQHDPITRSMLETFAHVAESRLRALQTPGGPAMPDCAQCTDADLGRICPHQGPGLALWEQGLAAGRAEVAAVLIDLIAELRAAHKPLTCACGCGFEYDTCICLGEWPCDETLELDRAEARLREVSGDE